MSFFNKFKNQPSAPPALPRRIANNGGSAWPEDEFDEEEGDMYEVPPCERPVIKVPPNPSELDFIYLDRSADKVAPQRQAAPLPRQAPPPPRQPVPAQRRGTPPQRPLRQSVPPPRQAAPPQTRQIPPPIRPAGAAPTRPTKLTPMGNAWPLQREAEVFHDPAVKKPPEVDRKEKPGKKGALKKMPPPPIHATPLPAPPQQAEEDVYVDPNEEQGDSDDVYLQPTPACPLPSRGPMRLPSPLSPTVAPPVPMCMMKPPVPRALSNSLLPSVSEMKAVKPLYLASNKDSQTRPLSPPMVDQMSEATGNEDDKWFAGDCKRKRAEELLQRINKDGAFLIRCSSSQDPRQPYTLAVLYSQKVYNIPIRFMEETQGYALGKEGRENEESFSSLQDIILHHKNNQLLLIDSMSQAMHKTYLVQPARP